ncbi:MAG: hypothetical protein H7258_13140 [Ferruginibacter sp.]|nr:hypothetical protein [Ferruginibacter sp.]
MYNAPLCRVLEKEYGASPGIFGSVNSLGQVPGVVPGGMIIIRVDHLAYRIIAAMLVVIAYLGMDKK